VRAFLRLGARGLGDTEPLIELVLIQGLPKGEKMDVIVQKAVEVGAARILPVPTRRSVPKYDERKAAARVARWQRIAREAARQSRRGRIPDVLPIQTWEAAVTSAAVRIESGEAAGWMAWEMESALGLVAAASGRRA